MGEPLFVIILLLMFLCLRIMYERASPTPAARMKTLQVGTKTQVRSHGRGAWEQLVASAPWKTEEWRHDIRQKNKRKKEKR